jgi:hypothetical protein
MVSNGQITQIKANDFLPDSACSAGGLSTVSDPSTSSSGEWEINLVLGNVNDTINPAVNYNTLMGEAKFINKIPVQVGGADTKISDLISVNSTDFILKAKASRAVDSNYDCNKPGANDNVRLRFSLVYQGTIVENGPDITFSIFLTDQGAANPAPEEVIVTMTPPRTASIDKLEKYDFSFGPNPTENLIYLSASKSIGKVEVFNLVGQKSLSTDLRTSKGTLDISNLSRGIYIMNVAIDKNIGTYKLIKR